MKSLFLCLAVLLVAACGETQNKQLGNAGLFDKDNLVAWCIVPFDIKERGPEERAAMLKQLGISRVAYDWREKHVPEFEEEILAYKKQGLEYFAFWGEHPAAFALFQQYGIHPQIWKTAPAPKGETQADKIEYVARSLLPLVEKTAAMGCKFGIYNHGGWQGEPENMVAIVKWLRNHTAAEHVGIVYNLHHGHDHIGQFEESLRIMLPYLHCLNLNGMNPGADPKILPLGLGEHDQRLLQIIAQSGYTGRIGIIGHQDQLDVEVVLRDNLKGLNKLVASLK